jgi:hypothetical protein
MISSVDYDIRHFDAKILLAQHLEKKKKDIGAWYQLFFFQLGAESRVN